MSDPAYGAESARITAEFEDNSVLTELFGPHNRNLAEIEQAFDVVIAQRGNLIEIGGAKYDVRAARETLERLEGRITRGLGVEQGDVRGAIRLARGDDKATPTQGELMRESDAPVEIRTRKKVIQPRSKTQRSYMQALTRDSLTFGVGPAGTGKTYLAVAAAVAMFLDRKVERIVLSRPAVEAGERLGFLPGDMKDKVDPYLRPLYDALHDMLPGDQVTKFLEQGVFEVAPLAFMRGRTLSNAFVVLDEAQNCTRMQMKMFLTRLGENACMAVTGDPSQIDLPRGEASGLVEALGILRGVKGVSVTQFTGEDVVRHPLVARIVAAYEASEERNRDRA